MNFKAMDLQLSENLHLAQDIQKLVNKIISLNQCQFKNEELGFKIDTLVVENVLINNGVLTLAENPLLYYIALKQFQQKYNYTPTISLTDLFNFLDEVNKYFIYKGKPVQGKSKFLAGIYATALLEHHQKYHPPIDEFSNSWKSEPTNVMYPFSRALSKILPFIEYETNDLMNLLRKLYLTHEFDKPNTYNGNIAELHNGIKEFSIAHPSRARQLLNQLQDEDSLLNQTIIIPILSGLLDENLAFLDEIASLSLLKVNHLGIICALYKINEFSETQVNNAITIINSFTNEEKQYRQQLPGVYCRILNNNQITANEIFTYSLHQIKIILVDKDLDVTFSAINSLRLINKREEEITELLIFLIKQSHFNQQLIDAIASIFFDFEDCNLVFNFLYAYAEQFPYGRLDSFFDHVIPFLRPKNETVFDQRLISFLIHNNGKIRWMGQRLFAFLSFSRELQSFSVDVLKLTASDQFKLMTSVLGQLHEPKYTIRFLFPLFDSKSEIVKEGFICRLELLTDEYGSSVTDILKNHWGIELTTLQKEIYERIEKHMISFSNNLSLKNQIKEFNPWYTQSAFLHTFMSQYGKEQSRKMEENVDKNSIFRQLAKTVVLAKGGGWKHPTKKEVSQLTKFSSSMALPRSLFISPDNFEWENRLNIIEDWSKYNDLWEVIV